MKYKFYIISCLISFKCPGSFWVLSHFVPLFLCYSLLLSCFTTRRNKCYDYLFLTWLENLKLCLKDMQTCFITCFSLTRWMLIQILKPLLFWTLHILGLRTMFVVTYNKITLQRDYPRRPKPFNFYWSTYLCMYVH